jgi:hypothetical protein
MKVNKIAREQPFAYGSVLAALSQGLYPDKKHVIRELVQNAYDAILALKSKHPEQTLRPVQVKVEGSSIFVADYGIGMAEQKMKEYRYLGFSEKVVGQDAGFRGIGKFSPISLCKRIIVDSSRFGIPRRFRVVIDAEGMMERIRKERNPPLDLLLSDHTSLDSASAPTGDHYTFVELEGVRNDAKNYLDVEALKVYLSRTAPLSLDPQFKYSETIDKRLRQYVPGHLAIDVTVNAQEIYKNFIEPCNAPKDTLVWNTSNNVLLAYAWSCANENPGIFEQMDNASSADRRHPDAGLIFKVKNISVGDRFLPRRTFWKSSSELSFHFFGEIHVLNAGVVPSSDRNDFEDNVAREELYSQCSKIARDLNFMRRSESTERNFEKAVDAVNTAVTAEESKLASNSLPIELRDETKYGIRSTVENLKKRLKQSRDPKKRKAANAAVKRGEKLLAQLDSINAQGVGFVDITEALKFDARCKALYSTIIGVLRDEFRYDGKRLEKLIGRIHEAITASKI